MELGKRADSATHGRTTAGGTGGAVHALVVSLDTVADDTEVVVVVLSRSR